MEKLNFSGHCPPATPVVVVIVWSVSQERTRERRRGKGKKGKGKERRGGEEQCCRWNDSEKV
jgi:hypothetical protein